MVPIGTLISSAQNEERAEYQISSSGGDKRPAEPQEDDAQKPTKAARVTEAAASGKSTQPAANLYVITSINAEGKQMHLPQWAVKHAAISTSHFGITPGFAAANAPPTAPTPLNIETPLYDRLCACISRSIKAASPMTGGGTTRSYKSVR